MPPPSSSSSSLFLLVLLAVVRLCGAEDAACSAAFRSGQEDFVLDVEDAVKAGAALLVTARVPSAEACRSACCADALCNLALLQPRGDAAEAAGRRDCVLFNCVYRNRFVCRFVNNKGFQSYIRESVFQKHLRGPRAAGDGALPIAIAPRDVIIQPGEVVTLSGIQSLAMGAAHISRYQWSLFGADVNVTMESGSFVFQLTVIDSNDQRSRAANVSVLVLDPERSSTLCLSPPKVGPCRAAFHRWRYNATTGACEHFLFGGCKSNSNNFLSEDECVSACRGVSASSQRSVSLPAPVCGSPCGPGQLTCDSDCCVDTSLECDGVKQCGDGADEEQCSKLNATFHHLLHIHVNQKKARCAEPPLTGSCRASFTRWYYDPLNRKCSRFTWGGCDGNENNFEKEDECSKACEGVTERDVFFPGMFNRFEAEEEESESGKIGLAVCLSVAILALLAVLTYCFLKSRKERSHRPLATGPAHVALSEQDTLVYNNTTKPI
ncbi:kunitz-type protease inhibitor 1b isoform 2-T2 [Spinachia spinachia]